MHIAPPSTRSRLAFVGALAISALFWVPAAQATEREPAAGALQATVSGRGVADRINLLSPPRGGQPVVRVRAMGAGSWVCSPAGFGQRSRCYRN
jgi:hypothetical protein